MQFPLFLSGLLVMAPYPFKVVLNDFVDILVLVNAFSENRLCLSLLRRLFLDGKHRPTLMIWHESKPELVFSMNVFQIHVSKGVIDFGLRLRRTLLCLLKNFNNS